MPLTIIYDKNTGEVIRQYRYSAKHPETLVLKDNEDHYPDFVEVEEDDGEGGKTTRKERREVSHILDTTHRMSEKKPIQKDIHPVTIDKTSVSVGEDITLSGIVTGTLIVRRGGGGGDRVTSDEDVVMAFDSPDTYEISVNHPLYKPVVFTVEVT